MDDRRLTQLLQMAAEAERMETGRSGFDSAEIDAMPRVLTRRTWSVQPWMGIAAALAVTSVIGWSLMPTTPTPQIPPVAHNALPKQEQPATVTVSDEGVSSGTAPARLATNTASDPCASESTMLMALFQSADGAVRSTRVAISDWDSRRGLDDMGEGEILGLAFEHIEELTAETLPDKVVLVAVSGPSSLLPDSEGDARVLQACLEGAPSACGDQPICYTSAAQQCLPSGLSVAVETRAMR